MGFKLKIKSGLKRISKEMSKAQEIIKPGAQLITDAAKADAPRDTGAMADSIRVVEVKTGVEAVTAITVNVDYANIAEAREPFLAPATDSNEKRIVKSQAEQINKKIQKGRVK